VNGKSTLGFFFTSLFTATWSRVTRERKNVTCASRRVISILEMKMMSEDTLSPSIFFFFFFFAENPTKNENFSRIRIAAAAADGCHGDDTPIAAGNTVSDVISIEGLGFYEGCLIPSSFFRLKNRSQNTTNGADQAALIAIWNGLTSKGKVV